MATGYWIGRIDVDNAKLDYSADGVASRAAVRWQAIALLAI